MTNFFRGIIRSSSFFRKEIFEILRQPRLVATLVLGPFLILFIFGVGYRAQSRTLRTLFVAQSSSAISPKDIQQYSKAVNTVIIYAGVTDNLNSALDQLNKGQVDLVIVDPENAASILKKNQQAVFTLYHHEIDPAQVNYVNYLGWLYVGVVNQQVLLNFAGQARKDLIDLVSDLQEAHQNLTAVRQAVQSGDQPLAQQKQQDATDNINKVSQGVGASLGLLDLLQPSGGDTAPLEVTLTDLRQNISQLGNTTDNQGQRLARLDKIDKDITNLDGGLAQLQGIDPSVLISPFRDETKSTDNIPLSTSDFFAPAVLALLLQHLAVTFAALSIVRERNAGTLELFRISPVTAAETLFGKYISYMVFGSVIAAILAALLAFVLHVPMLGNWWYFALVSAAVLFTSLGIGFVISIISQTDSQAVQYSMIVLLASVFFSGFIISLDMLSQPVRVISWMLPTTYGTLLLRDIALRGIAPNWVQLSGLIAIGLALMLISWRLLHQLITASR